MAGRMAARRAAVEAERKRVEAEDQARLSVEFPAVEGEHDYVETEGEHRGHRWHGHPLHALVTVCSCGARELSDCAAITLDMPRDRACPVCVARGVSPVGR
jgi:hypothetical protein